MELRFEHIYKRYGNHLVLNDIDLSLTEGVYGFLGANGAGKSTLMNILTGNLQPTFGRILLGGEDVSTMGSHFRSRIGYCPQQQTLYPSFTPWQFLSYMSALHGMEKQYAAGRIMTLLDMLSLSDVQNRPIRALSGGMKQRILLAQALLHDPDILVLDEPTAGLDPQQRIAVRNLIGEMALHKTVLISTHVVQDVEYISRELVLLRQGTVLRRGTAGQLTQELYGVVWEVEATAETLDAWGRTYTVCGINREETRLRVRLLHDGAPVPEAVAVRPTLEDVYLHFFEGEQAL